MSVVTQDLHQKSECVAFNDIVDDSSEGIFDDLDSTVESVKSVKDDKTNPNVNNQEDSKSTDEEQKVDSNESDLQASPTLPRKNTKPDTRIILSLDTSKSNILEWPSFETTETAKLMSKGNTMTPDKHGNAFQNNGAKAIEESKEVEPAVVTDTLTHYNNANQSTLTATDFATVQTNNSDEALSKKKKGMRKVFRWRRKGKNKNKNKQIEELKETVDNEAVVPAPETRNSDTYKLYEELIKSFSGDESECTDMLYEQYKKSVVRFKSSESIIAILPRQKKKKVLVQKRTYFCGLFEEYDFTQPSESSDENSDDYASDDTSEKMSSNEFGDESKSLDSIESTSHNKKGQTKSQSNDSSILNEVSFGDSNDESYGASRESRSIDCSIGESDSF